MEHNITTRSSVGYSVGKTKDTYFVTIFPHDQKWWKNTGIEKEKKEYEFSVSDQGSTDNNNL